MWNPRSAISSALTLPTLPQPCTATVVAVAQLAGVDDHAALRATVRNVHQRALPRHPHGEGLHLLQAGVGMKPDPALGGPARGVVLDPVALEDAQRTVIHLHRKADQQLATHLAKHGAQPWRKVEDCRGVVELSLRVSPGIVRVRRRRGGCGRGHAGQTTSRGMAANRRSLYSRP